MSWALLGGALARLYVLGEARGWALVAPVAGRITGLTLVAWAAHLVWHELGHLAASRLARFRVDAVTLGPFEWSRRSGRWSWSGLSLSGRLSTLPVGAEQLRRRLRLVASGGPLFTAAATLGLWAAWASRGEAVTSPLGISVVAGGLVLLSASIPGRFREVTAVAGNDVDQIVGARPVLAHWTYLAVVQAVLSGRRPSDLTRTVDLQALLPGPDEPPEPISVIAVIHHLELGGFRDARALLDAMTPKAEDAVQWVHIDLFHQSGALAALVEGDLWRATECLAVVRAQQTLPWYSELLEACLAWASGDATMADQRLARWLDEATRVSGGRLAFGGNEWILDRLKPDWRAARRLAEVTTAQPELPP